MIREHRHLQMLNKIYIGGERYTPGKEMRRERNFPFYDYNPKEMHIPKYLQKEHGSGISPSYCRICTKRGFHENPILVPFSHLNFSLTEREKLKVAKYNFVCLF